MERFEKYLVQHKARGPGDMREAEGIKNRELHIGNKLKKMHIDIIVIKIYQTFFEFRKFTSCVSP